MCGQPTSTILIAKFSRFTFRPSNIIATIDQLSTEEKTMFIHMFKIIEGQNRP